MIRKIRTAIRTHNLFSSGDRVLAAVSGGADSVCLLHALHELAPDLALDLTVAHLDHRLRGAASRGDAKFVTDLAAGLGVPCVTGSSDVRRRARRKGLSLEMAAREARYEFFARCAREVGAGVVATAHTADDRAETVVLKLVRGAGAAGLGGIARDTVLRGLRVVRPMLDISRSDIEAFLKQRGVSWREDASNSDVSFLRNRVRHEVLPLLESRLNPSLRRALCRTAEVLSQEERWIDDIVDGLARICTAREPGRGKARGKVCPEVLIADTLRAVGLAPRRRVIRRWLMSNGVPAECVGFDAVARVNGLTGADATGSTVDVGGGWTVTNRYGKLVLAAGVARVPSAAFRERVAIPGETVLPDAGLRVETWPEGGVEKPGRTRAGELPARASISRAAVGRRGLYVRSWRHGDRIRPLGLKGSKKVQDIFVNDKVPPEQRGCIPLFECAGEIVWLPGYRVARGWEVTDESTPALQMRVEWI